MSGCFKTEGRICVCDDCVGELVASRPVEQPKVVKSVNVDELVATLRGFWPAPVGGTDDHDEDCWRHEPWCLLNVAADCIDSLINTLQEMS